jgi:hypothetical protein
MAISSAMVRSVFDIDLINVINSLSAFARECIHEHGIIEHDAGDIADNKPRHCDVCGAEE